jgi:hypothetical protein
LRPHAPKQAGKPVRLHANLAYGEFPTRLITNVRIGVDFPRIVPSIDTILTHFLKFGKQRVVEIGRRVTMMV